MLDIKLKYIVKRIGKSSDRVTNGKMYIAEYCEVYSGTNVHGSQYGWKIKKTDDPKKDTVVSLHPQSAVWEIIGPHVPNKFRYFRKINSKNGVPDGTLLKIDAATGKSTPDSPFTWGSAFASEPPRCNWIEISEAAFNDADSAPQFKYYKKIKTENVIPVGTLLKIDTTTNRSAPDSPYKWTTRPFNIKHSKEFWEEICELEYRFYAPQPAEEANERLITEDEFNNFLNENLTKEPTMAKPTKVETVVQINGENASILSNDAIIAAIKDEQQSIACLEEVKTESSFITKQIAEHKAAITALIEILDAR